MATASDGLYLEPDSAPYTSGAMSVDSDIADGTKYTAARSAIWAQYYSYGIDLGSAQSITRLDVSCDIDEEGTPRTPNGWDADGDDFSVYGSTDNSSWTLIESFSTPSQSHTGSGELTFQLSFSGATAEYRYFKVVATGSNGCQVTCVTGNGNAYIGEIEYFSMTNVSDTIEVTESVAALLSHQAAELTQNITVSDSVTIYRVFALTGVSNSSLELTSRGRTPSGIIELVWESGNIIGHGAINFPAFELEGYGGGSGAIDFPEFVLEGTGHVSNLGHGAIKFPEFVLEAYGGGTGAIKFPDFVLAATGMVSIIGHGAINFPEFVVEGEGNFVNGAGAINFPHFRLAGTGVVSEVGNGAIKFPIFQLAGTGYVGMGGAGAINFPEFILAATGYQELDGDGAIDFPDFIIHGTGYTGSMHDDTILRHQEDERFIT